AVHVEGPRRELRHEHAVTHEQRVLHRLARDEERLDEERLDEEGQRERDDDDDRRLLERRERTVAPRLGGGLLDLGGCVRHVTTVPRSRHGRWTPRRATA